MAKAIPEGYHSITPYLVVNDAAAAIDYYKRAFDAKETYRHPGPDGKSIVNAELKIEDSILLLSDEFPHGGCLSPKSFGECRTSIFGGPDIAAPSICMKMC
jgi:PhnB protein